MIVVSVYVMFMDANAVDVPRHSSAISRRAFLMQSLVDVWPASEY